MNPNSQIYRLICHHRYMSVESTQATTDKLFTNRTRSYKQARRTASRRVTRGCHVSLEAVRCACCSLATCRSLSLQMTRQRIRIRSSKQRHVQLSDQTRTSVPSRDVCWPEHQQIIDSATYAVLQAHSRLLLQGVIVPRKPSSTAEQDLPSTSAAPCTSNSRLFSQYGPVCTPYPLLSTAGDCSNAGLLPNCCC